MGVVKPLIISEETARKAEQINFDNCNTVASFHKLFLENLTGQEAMTSITNNNNALDIAILLGNKAVIGALLNLVPQSTIDAFDKLGSSPLNKAFNKGDLESAEVLLGMMSDNAILAARTTSEVAGFISERKEVSNEVVEMPKSFTTTKDFTLSLYQQLGRLVENIDSRESNKAACIINDKGVLINLVEIPDFHQYIKGLVENNDCFKGLKEAGTISMGRGLPGSEGFITNSNFQIQISASEEDSVWDNVQKLYDTIFTSSITETLAVYLDRNPEVEEEVTGTGEFVVDFV